MEQEQLVTQLVSTAVWFVATLVIAWRMNRPVWWLWGTAVLGLIIGGVFAFLGWRLGSIVGMQHPVSSWLLPIASGLSLSAKVLLIALAIAGVRRVRLDAREAV